MDTRSALTLPFAMFLTIGLVGVALTWFMAVAPALRKVAARDWQPVECTISHSRGGSRNYLNEFTYAYQGTTYHGDQYSFYRRWSNARYQDGARVTGALDPHHPEDAVLRPDDVPPAWAFAAMAAFCIIPWIGAVQFWRLRARTPAGGAPGP